MVDLGDHVLGALVADPTDPPETIDEERPGGGGHLPGEGELGGEDRRRAIADHRRHGPVHSTASGRTAVPSPMTGLVNVTCGSGFDLRAEHERRVRSEAGRARVVDPAGRRTARRPEVVDGQGDRQAPVGRGDPADPALERADAAERGLAEDGQGHHGDDDRQDGGAVRLRRGRLLEAERVAALAHRRAERDDRPAPDAVLGRLVERGRGSHRDAGSFMGSRMVPRTARWGAGRLRRARSYQRPVAATSASTSAVVRAVTTAPSAPASRQRCQVSRGASIQGLAPRASSPDRPPWTPTRTSWSARSRPAASSDSQVDRQTRLEGRVEGGPPVADPAGQPGPRRGLAADQDPGDGTGHRTGHGFLERIERRRSADRPSRPQGAQDRDGLLEPGGPLGRLRERDPQGTVLGRVAADPDAQDRVDRRSAPGG